MKSIVRLACVPYALAVLLGCSGSPTRPPLPIGIYTLRGIVLAPDGGPAANAFVVLTHPGLLGSVWWATADTTGEFSIDDVPSIFFHVDALGEPQVGGRTSVTVPVPDVEVRLSLSGYVRGIATRTGVTNQSDIAISCTFPFSHATTDSTGAYLLWTPAGRWSINAYVPGYTSNIISVTVASGDTVAAPDLRLQPDFNP